MFPTDQVRKALAKVLASTAFAGSERMSRFLYFIVERQLSGRSAELKEYTIGVEVFDRGERYDPRVDPIVRVEARRLRSKLEAYYKVDGQADDVVIDLPKGSYVPVFRTRAEAAPLSAAETGPRSVAVLPFENASIEADAVYLSDGLTQQIIHRLTRVQGLRVVGWSSADRVRGRRDAGEAGRVLHASHVVTGSIRASAGRLRVMAQLVEVETGAYLWSEIYDRTVSDLLTLEEEISRAIVDALEVRLGIVRPSTRDPRAYEIYLRGRHYWNKRTGEGMRRAVTLFREALDLDPSFALAWVGLADTYMLLADYGLARSSDVMEAARRAALQALELSPAMGEAEACLGMIRSLYDWQWDEGGEHYRRAMELSPGYATAFHWYSVDYCALRGMFSEGAKAMEIACEAEPLSSIIRVSKGYLWLLERRFEECYRFHRELVGFDPGFYKNWTAIGRVCIQLGRLDEAIEALEHARTLDGGDQPHATGALGQALALRGDRARARQLLNGLEETASRCGVPATAYAAIHLGLGEHDKAIEALRSGCDSRQLSICNLGVHPLWDPLRTNAAFNELVERIGAVK